MLKEQIAHFTFSNTRAICYFSECENWKQGLTIYITPFGFTFFIKKRATRTIHSCCSLKKEWKEWFTLLKNRKSDSLFFVKKRAIRTKNQRANSQPCLSLWDLSLSLPLLKIPGKTRSQTFTYSTYIIYIPAMRIEKTQYCTFPITYCTVHIKN